MFEVKLLFNRIQKRKDIDANKLNCTFVLVMQEYFTGHVIFEVCRNI